MSIMKVQKNLKDLKKQAIEFYKEEYIWVMTVDLQK